MDLRQMATADHAGERTLGCRWRGPECNARSERIRVNVAPEPRMIRNTGTYDICCEVVHLDNIDSLDQIRIRSNKIENWWRDDELT